MVKIMLVESHKKRPRNIQGNNNIIRGRILPTNFLVFTSISWKARPETTAGEREILLVVIKSANRENHVRPSGIYYGAVDEGDFNECNARCEKNIRCSVGRGVITH